MAGGLLTQARLPLWHRCTVAWTQFQEPQMVPLYNIVLKAIGSGHKLRLLDLGCASGIFCHRAAHHDFDVAGVDLCNSFVTVAASRVPCGLFIDEPMEKTSLPEASFDVVTCLNTIYYSASPVETAREAHRLLKPGGRFIISTWGLVDHCDSARVMTHFYSQSKKSREPWHSPFAFSRDGLLQALLQKTGFACQLRAEADLLWNYPDEQTAHQALLGCEQGQRALEHSGEEAVTDGLRTTLAPFRLPTGGFRLRNRYKYVVAQKR